MKRVFIVFVVTLLFCNAEEKYTFLNNINEGHKVTYKLDDIMTFNLPGMGEIRQGGNRTQLLEHLGKQGEFVLVRSTLSNITSINVMGDRVATDYDAQTINNISCLLYLDINGKIDHLEADEQYLEDLFKKKYMNINVENYIYPFGKNGMDIAVGDSWTSVHDSVKFFMDESGSESLMSTSSVYTLDKVKYKKGINVAYISEKSTVDCQFKMHIQSEWMDGLQTGTFKTSYRYDIDNGKMIRYSTSGETEGDFTVADFSFKAHTYFSNSLKMVK